MANSDEVKRMDISEFREKGYLKEINRRFLHPLGLALEVVFDEEGNEKLGGIWDSREDSEGFYFDLANSSEKRVSEFQKAKEFIDHERGKRYENRINKFGSFIEEIPHSPIDPKSYFLEDVVDWENNMEYNYFVQDGDGQLKYFVSKPAFILDQDEYYWKGKDNQGSAIVGNPYNGRAHNWRQILTNPHKKNSTEE